jgi:hypothetical protein
VPVEYAESEKGKGGSPGRPQTERGEGKRRRCIKLDEDAEALTDE